MRQRIKNIVIEEFSNLTKLIEADFRFNFKRKVNNYLLSQMDEKITASMVFVSSFESKSGFAIETCAKRITRLKFGDENVPTIVNPRNLPHNIDESAIKGQIVVTDVDSANGNLRGEIAAFRANNVAYGKGKKRVESGVTMENIRKTLLPLSQKYKTDRIFSKPVDLAFYDGKMWNIMELKAGGDLDSSNAPSNVEKLLNIYVDMGIENCNAYFATLYNKDGEGNVWKGAVKKHLNYPSMFLIGADFWERILPCGFTFEDFIEIYREALEEIDLNRRINRMISDCIGE
ncbi:MAG: TdeIII family type II restriction endonuclease [Eubacterium sp.]|nr:TdeIII family type II restriction endonuclease [Eubacterium sp.]